MRRLFYVSLQIVLLFALVSVAAADSLDDYYLQQFGEYIATGTEKSVHLMLENQDVPHCGMPLKKGLQQDWNALQPATQKVLAKQLAAPVLTGEAIHTSAHFRFHYAASGSDAPPLADVNGNTIPDWIETVAATFEDVYNRFQTQGYRMPPTSAGLYEIYLRDLAPQSLYGQTTSTSRFPVNGYPNSFGSYMEIDNNFSDSKFINAAGGPYSPLQSLQITAAHEFQHAIQYGYNYYFDIWYAEATSTWLEDELYDSVNQLYNYLPAWLRNSSGSLDAAVDYNALNIGAGYGRWIFNRHLAERFGVDAIRNAWQSLAPIPSPTGADIPMTPVMNTLLSNSYNSTLGNEFYNFAKNTYTRNWGSHTDEISKIPGIVPVATYSSYPVNSLSTPQPSINLPHYSFAWYRFIPQSDATSLKISLSAAGNITHTVFVKLNNAITEIAPTSNGTSYSIGNFSQLNPGTDEVVLLLVNNSATDNQTADFTTENINLPPNRLNIAISGTGSGTVTLSTANTIPCTSTPCAYDIVAGETINLYATPSIGSLFSGWSGPCSGNSNCYLIMNNETSVVAAFTTAQNVMVNNSTYYGTIQSAYDSPLTVSGAHIKLLGGNIAGLFTANRTISLLLDGGYDPLFSTSLNATGIPSPLTISSGTVKLRNIIIK